MPKLSYNKDILASAVAKSFSISETLRNLDMCFGGGSHSVVKRYIDIWDIDISHFDSHHYQRKGESRATTAIPLEDVLVEHSTYSRHALKRRLYETGLKTPACEMDECGQGEVWRGHPMSLILDHINGVRDDNRLENLRIVCPNCNATLDTHCGRKRPIGFVKVDRRVGRKGPRLDQRRVIRPELDVLLSDVATLGYSGTGRKYGVSDNAIRKWIKIDPTFCDGRIGRAA